MPSGKGMVVELQKTLPMEFSSKSSFIAEKSTPFILHVCALLKGARSRCCIVGTEMAQLQQQNIGRTELAAQECRKGCASSLVEGKFALYAPSTGIVCKV